MDRRHLIVNCATNILPRINNLSNHEKSEKRKWRAPLQGQTQLSVIKTPRYDMDKVKAIELQIAVSMTCHCVVRIIDNLSKFMVAHGHGSTLELIDLHRNKCACLIRNIILPALKTDLIDDFQNKKYAIITDESTDISAEKHLCMVVRFLSDRRKKLVTGYIGLILVQKKMFSLIDEGIKRCGQSLADCIGFATDGASNMVGCNNSVWSRLKAVSPFCMQLKCSCHSLALCIQYAVSTLPLNIGFLLSEIPSWFHHSELR